MLLTKYYQTQIKKTKLQQCKPAGGLWCKCKRSGMPTYELISSLTVNFSVCELGCV